MIRSRILKCTMSKRSGLNPRGYNLFCEYSKRRSGDSSQVIGVQKRQMLPRDLVHLYPRSSRTSRSHPSRSHWMGDNGHCILGEQDHRRLEPEAATDSATFTKYRREVSHRVKSFHSIRSQSKEQDVEIHKLSVNAECVEWGTSSPIA